MTDEEEAFIAGVEMGIDWNLYIPPSDHARYDYLIRQQNRKEKVELNRLTYKEDDGSWGLRGMFWAQIDTKAHPELYMALCKLKDYEDIGLNPDQVERLNELYLDKCREVNELQEILDDRQAKLVEKKIVLEERLIQKRDELIRRHEEIEQAIDSLNDIRERTVLRLRYIKGLKLEDICYAMGYSWRQINRIQERALQNIQKNI